MQWLDKWLAKRVKRGLDLINRACMEQETATDANYMTVGTAVKSLNGRSPSANGMQFTVYPANGGHVLEYQYYDQKTDRHTASLHLITADQNMGEVIGQAITFEMLKR